MPNENQHYDISISPKIAQSALKIMLASISLNLVLAISKATTGIFGNSYALVADAVESTADILTSIIVYVGLKIALKKPDKNHPYGHGKAEPIAAIIVGITLFFAGILICVQATQNILTPQEKPELFTLPILIIVILIKEGLFQYLRYQNKQTKSLAIEADAWHHRLDAVSSISALVGISISIFFGEGFETADDWSTFVAAGIIFFNAYRVCKPPLDEIMDIAPDENIGKIVRSAAKKIDGVIEIEKCFVRKMGFNYYVDIHVVVSANLTVFEGHLIGHQVKDKIIKEIPIIMNVLTHIEPHTTIP